MARLSRSATETNSVPSPGRPPPAPPWELAQGPGTGLAQVKGRNAMPWAERLAWDVRYVETRSFALDCRIVLDTFKVVLAREGITEEGQVAMTDFEGAPDVEV